MDKIRIGVIGLRFGRQLVRTLANMEDARIVALADRSFDGPEGLYDYAAHYGANAYLDGEELMQREALDAVVICTSPLTRANLMRCAIDEGLAMFVEKPWATNVRHARELASLCGQSQQPVMTAFSFRYHPAIMRLRELMAGALGPGWLLNGSYIFNWQPDPGGWLWDPDNGGGFINENSCHLFDGVCSLLGAPVSVMAEASTRLHAPSENTAAVTLRFENGAVAALTIGGVGAQAQRSFPRMEVITVNGHAILSGHEHVWTELAWTTRSGDSMRTEYSNPERLGDTRYTDAFNHFFHCIRTGEQPETGPDAGVTSVAVAMAVYESARTGKKVKLDL